MFVQADKKSSIAFMMVGYVPVAVIFMIILGYINTKRWENTLR